jgi:ankyrin repeat protein
VEGNIVFKQFLDKGVDINATYPRVEGYSLHGPALWAAEHRRGRFDDLMLLLELGADPRVSDIDSETPLQVAEVQGFDDIVELLKETVLPARSSFE